MADQHHDRVMQKLDQQVSPPEGNENVAGQPSTAETWSCSLPGSGHRIHRQTPSARAFEGRAWIGNVHFQTASKLDNQS